MTAVLVKAITDLRRRRLQALVIFFTTLLAVGLLQSIYVQARASEALKGRVPLSPERARY